MAWAKAKVAELHAELPHKPSRTEGIVFPPDLAPKWPGVPKHAQRRELATGVKFLAGSSRLPSGWRAAFRASQGRDWANRGDRS